MFFRIEKNEFTGKKELYVNFDNLRIVFTCLIIFLLAWFQAAHVDFTGETENRYRIEGTDFYYTLSNEATE